MWPYWLMFAVAALLVLMPGKLRASQARWAWLVVALLLALVMGLRHEVGGDWYNYLRQFGRFSSESLGLILKDAKDPGYSFFGWLAAQLGGGIHLLNLMCAVPLALGIVALARRQPWPMLAVLVAIPYLIIVVGMGYTRQSAAIGYAMLGLVALGERRQRAFVFWILVAAAFHKTAVLLLPIAALAATRNRVWSYIWIGVLSVVGAWLFFIDSSEVLWDNYVVSDYADASQGAAIRVFMNAVPAAIVLILGRRLFSDAGQLRIWRWMAIISIATVFLLPVSPTAVDRMALYFIPLQIVVFASLPRTSSNVQYRTLIVLGAIFYYASVQFVWLNFASHAGAWIPYQFMPLWP